MTNKLIIRPYWVEPEFLKEQGYKLISDKNGYLKYESSWEYKALHRKGRDCEQLLGNGKRIIYFNGTFSPEENLVFTAIEEDGGTRKVYNGVVDSAEFLIKLLIMVE